MMKHASLALAATFLATASASFADERVFLLQLGSYENRADAQTRWASLKETYPELLDGLSVRLLDVTLPPDNFTVYRTQAGALQSRADAQIICEKLNARGDECYVVETAMFQPQELQQMQQAAQPMSAPAFSAPTLADDVPQLLAPDMVPPAMSAAMPADSLEAEMQRMEANLGQQQALAPASEAPMLEMGDGLEPLPEENKESFWSWLNPFSSSKPQAAQVAQMPAELPAQEMVYDAVPSEPVSSLDLRLPPPPEMLAPRANAPAEAPAPALITPSGARVPVAAMQPQQPLAAMPSNLPFQVKRDGQPVAMPSVAAGGQFVPAGDEVRVAEAVPVPVTQPARSGPAPLSAQQLRALGTPSKPAMAGKNIWAEVKYFESQQEALAFWDEFRRSNPNFPPARVRVTNPYLAAGGTRPRVGLRVGPFEYGDAVAAICAQVRGEEAQCGAVRDLGESVTSGRHRGYGAGEREQARYSKRGNFGEPMYWVQLGGYASAQAAHAQWARMQEQFAPVLSGAKPSVSLPQSSSALQTSYRLRTGPYAMRPQADALCNTLKAQGAQCLTVFSN